MNLTRTLYILGNLELYNFELLEQIDTLDGTTWQMYPLLI